VGTCQTSGVGEGVVPMMSQYFGPAQVSARLRQEIIDCWITVSNAGGAAGFPFPPVDASIVAPVADDLIAGLSPDRSRLIVARAGRALAGWVHLHRHPDPPVAHWGTVSHLQTLPAFRGRGVGSALMMSARQIARQEIGLVQLHLAARGGMGLERFYAQLGWREIGRRPGALRLAPDDNRDEVLMILAPL
jgi:GNAT superfamily N-acetyltransferase